MSQLTQVSHAHENKTLGPYEVGFNILNTIIGSGILGLPYAIKEAGFWFGVLLIGSVGLLAKFALELLVLCGDKLDSYDFRTNLKKTTGITGEFLMSFALMVNGFGSCITYLMISSDIFRPLTSAIVPPQYHDFISRTNVILFVGLVFVLPLLFFKNLDPLSKYSTFSILLIPPVIILLVIRAPFYSDTIPPLKGIGNDPLPAIGIISFALMCTQTAYQNFNSLDRHNSHANWGIASSFAIKFSVAVYVSFSVVGYLIFGDKVQPNILNNFGNNDITINIARLCMAVSIILTYPMQFYPMRDTLNPIISGFLQKVAFLKNNSVSPGESPQHSEPEPEGLALENRASFKILTFIWFSVTVAVSILVDDLGLVYKLLGTIAATLLAFILPACMYLYLDKSYFSSNPLSETSALIRIESQTTGSTDNQFNNKLNSCKSYFSSVSIFMLVFGVIILVIGTFVTLYYH